MISDTEANLMNEAGDNNPLAPFDDLLTEEQVCEKYRHLLSERELRTARQAGEIAFVTGKKGTVLYRPAWVAKYLDRKVTPCRPPQADSGSTAATGSAAPPVLTTSTPAGGLSEQNEHVAEALRRKFSPKLESA
jgi:hypothetical protein